MFAPAKQIEKACKAIKTDSKGVEEPKDPETNTVYKLYRLVATDAEREEMARRFRAGGYGYGDAKKELARKVLEYFAPFRERREELAKDPAKLSDILATGAQRARAVAARTLERVYGRVGLR
jgi:tryptophanyl-tRNA synthetase